MIEAACHLARQFDMGNLVLSHWYQSGLVDKDIGGLQQRISEKAIGGKIAIFELLLLILIAWHPFQPAEWGNHGEQQMQLRMCRHLRLNEKLCLARINADRQPVYYHLPDAVRNDIRVFVVRRQRMPVRDKKEAFVLMLEFYPVFQHAMIMTEMEASGRSHAG